MKLDTSTINGWQVEIHTDEDPSSPRDWTHGCELVLSMRNYDLPNEAQIDFADFESWTGIVEWLRDRKDALYVENVWGYSHSGISFKAGPRTYPYDDQWDSGLAGVAYVTLANWQETQGPDRKWTGSEEDQATASALIKGDVETYSQYVNGDVYGYVITDPVDGELQDSCWGFYGYEDVESAARDAIDGLTHEPKCNGSLNRRTGKIEHGENGCPVHKCGCWNYVHLGHCMHQPYSWKEEVKS